MSTCVKPTGRTCFWIFVYFFFEMLCFIFSFGEMLPHVDADIFQDTPVSSKWAFYIRELAAYLAIEHMTYWSQKGPLWRTLRLLLYIYTCSELFLQLPACSKQPGAHTNWARTVHEWGQPRTCQHWACIIIWPNSSTSLPATDSQPKTSCGSWFLWPFGWCASETVLP